MIQLEELDITSVEGRTEVNEIFLRRHGLLTRSEINKWIKKRLSFNYVIANKYKIKEDYIALITYEKNLREKIEERRKEKQIDWNGKEIEVTINPQIVRCCRYLTSYWPGHLDTWAIRIGFAKEIRLKEEVSAAYSEQTKHHDNPELYASWARYEMDERGDYEMARKILYTEASRHAESNVIKGEIFRLELSRLESLRKNQKDISGDEKDNLALENEARRAVYHEAVKVPSPQLYYHLYVIADELSFARDIQEEIYRDLDTAFPESDYVWKLKARKSVRDLRSADKKKDEPEKGKLSTPVKRLKAVIAVYDEALSAVGSSFLATYIEELLLMLHDCWGKNKLLKVIILKFLKLFESNKTTLLPEHFIIWFNILMTKPNSNDLLTVLLQVAVKAYPKVKLFKLENFRLKVNTGKGCNVKMRRLKNTVSSLKGMHGIEMFDLIVQDGADRKAKMLRFLRACDHSDEMIQKEVRFKYLDWINNHRPVKRSREFYKEYYMKPPFYSKFHVAMVMAELTKNFGSRKEIPHVFENAVAQFGENNPGLWVTYVYFEKYVRCSGLGGDLCVKAEKTLGEKQAEIFKHLIALVKQLERKQLDIVEKEDVNGEAESSESKSAWVVGKHIQEKYEEQKSAAVRLFKKNVLSDAGKKERQEFFSRISSMKEYIDKGTRNWSVALLNLEVYCIILERSPS